MLIATQVVAGLAEQPEALVTALTYPDRFHQFVLDHGGTIARNELIAERAEPVYDKVLAAATQQILALVPTSSRALTAGVGELLRGQEAAAATQAEVRDSISELVTLTRRQQSAEDRIASMRGSLPPHLAEEIIDLLDRVPQWADLAENLVDSDAPARLLQRLISSPPPWLNTAPGAAWELIGHALASYGAHETAADAYETAVDRMVSHPDEIKALAALTLHGNDQTAIPTPVQHRIAALLADNLSVLARFLKAARSHDMSAACDSAARLPQVTPRDRERRATLLASTLTACERYTEAEQILREHLPTAVGTGLHLMLTARLRNNALHRRSASRSAALLEAVEIALTARQRRRGWRGDAVAASLEAVEAAWALDDHRLVRQILTAAPVGDATDEEANDPRLLAIRALAAADVGDEQEALNLADRLDDFARLRVIAVCVTRRHQAHPTSSEVTGAWLSAWNAASSDAERLAAARGLLPHGGTAPGIDDLRRTQPEAMAEIDAVTDAALPRRGETPKSRVHRLSKAARTNLHAAVEYGDALARDGKIKAAASAWSEAADRFDDQRWRLHAAAALLQAGERPAVVATVENALSRSVPGWPGRRRAHILAIEAAADDQAWDIVASHARQLLALDDLPEVRWILAHSLCRLDDTVAAWGIIHRSGQILEPALGPNHRWQTGCQLDLVSRYGTPNQLFACAVEALRHYRDDEETSGEILTIVHTSQAHDPAQPAAPAVPVSSAIIDEFTALSEQFQNRFPHSSRFRALSIDPDDPDQLIQTLTQELAPRAAMLEDLEDKVGSGEFPVGIIATTLRRPYAEIHLRRSATAGTYLHRLDHDTIRREEAALTAAISAERAAALIDATALTTLTWLSDQIRSECLTGMHAQITRATFNDLRQARDNLARPSSGTISYDTRLERLIFTDVDQQQARTIAAAAAEMVDLAATLPRIRGESDSDLQLRGDTRPWLGLIATCRRQGLTLWIDDVALRQIAVAEQVPVFGTYTVLAHLHTDGILSSANHDAALFDLTRHRALDLPITLERLRLVASIDRWRPEAAALVLTRAAAWISDAPTCLSLLAEACTQRSTDPSDLANWAASVNRPGSVGGRC